MIKEIGKITIYVEDQQSAKTFWTEKVGFVVKAENQMGPNMTWLEVGPTEDSFTTFVLYNKAMMAQQNPNTDTGHPSIILSCTDIDATYEKLKENGVNVADIMKMPYGSMFSFKDQDGNNFLVRQD